MKKKMITTASAVLGLTATLVAPSVFATEQIAYALFQNDYATTCNLCHVNGNLSNSDKGNLMPAAKVAYNQDKWGLSGLQAFVTASAAPAGPVVPTCTGKQVLDTTTNTCVIPVPTCATGTVLNSAKDACVTPAPTTPVCTSEQVLNAAKTACVAKPSVVTPSVPVVAPLTCSTGQILNTTKTACVTKPASTPVTPLPVTKTNTKPILNAVTQQWDAKVGELLTIPLSVSDAEQDAFVMSGKTTGSTFSKVYTDEKTLLPTVDFQWTPTAAQVNKIYTITFQAKESKTKQKLASNKVSVKIRVWATGTSTAASITKLNVSTSAWKNGKLTLTGNVVFNNLLTAAEKKAFISTPLDLTVTGGKDPKGGALVGSAPLTLDAKGNWSTTFTLAQAQVPCDITLQYEGLVASRVVAGCIKPVATTTAITVAANTRNPFSDDDDREDDDHHDGKDDHDD